MFEAVGLDNPPIPVFLEQSLLQAHPSWHQIILRGICAMQKNDALYFQKLKNSDFLPTDNRLFAAFSIPLDQVRYVLIGEGPFPRELSASGYCFMDAAVRRIWSDSPDGGLSKQVNRATSLRNFIKMLLVADGCLHEDKSTSTALASIAMQARSAESGFIQSLMQLQNNLIREGFLLLNASLVFRKDVAPKKDAKAWQPFLDVVFLALLNQQIVSNHRPVSLVLWGRIAEQLQSFSCVGDMQKIIAEHPYNLSFIKNSTMQRFFGPMRLLKLVSTNTVD